MTNEARTEAEARVAVNFGVDGVPVGPGGPSDNLKLASVFPAIGKISDRLSRLFEEGEVEITPAGMVIDLGQASSVDGRASATTVDAYLKQA